MKKIALNVLNQIIPIMIGVYLGFALNNFGEDRQLKRQADTFRNMLRTEIGENLEELEGVRPYHAQLLEDFSGLLHSDDLKKAFEEYSLKGLRPGFVNGSAFNTGIQTGVIQQFDLNLIQLLNRLYTLQEKYNSFNESMIASLSSRAFPETEKEIRSVLISVSMSMTDVHQFEQELIRSYQLVLEQL